MVKQKETVVDVIIVFAIMYFWYYVLDVFFKLAELQIRAFLALILAIITFKLVGRKIMKYLT